MFSTTNVSDKWNMHGFGRMLSYEQYLEEKSCLWLSSFKKKIDQTSWRTNLKSCAYHCDFNLFQMIYKYISVSSEDFGSFKFHERKYSTRNLDDMHPIWATCLKLRRVVLHEKFARPFTTNKFFERIQILKEWKFHRLVQL